MSSRVGKQAVKLALTQIRAIARGSMCPDGYPIEKVYELARRNRITKDELSRRVYECGASPLVAATVTKDEWSALRKGQVIAYAWYEWKRRHEVPIERSEFVLRERVASPAELELSIDELHAILLNKVPEPFYAQISNGQRLSVEESNFLLQLKQLELDSEGEGAARIIKLAQQFKSGSLWSAIGSLARARQRSLMRTGALGQPLLMELVRLDLTLAERHVADALNSRFSSVSANVDAELGRRIRAWRERCHLSEASASHLANLGNTGQWSSFETGDGMSPSVNTLTKMAAALGLTYWELVDGPEPTRSELFEIWDAERDRSIALDGLIGLVEAKPGEYNFESFDGRPIAEIEEVFRGARNMRLQTRVTELATGQVKLETHGRFFDEVRHECQNGYGEDAFLEWLREASRIYSVPLSGSLAGYDSFDGAQTKNLVPWLPLRLHRMDLRGLARVAAQAWSEFFRAHRVELITPPLDERVRDAWGCLTVRQRNWSAADQTEEYIVKHLAALRAKGRT